jgi:hypothetical protein
MSPARQSAPESAQKVTQKRLLRLARRVLIDRQPGSSSQDKQGDTNMKKLLMVAASLMVVANVQAESFEIGVEMTPMVASKQVVAKADSRFDNYALENVAAGGQ